MVDVLYLLGGGACDIDNRPLRWSLRSLAKHAKNVGRVIVCGYIPDWLSDEVVKVDCGPVPGLGKHWNMLNGIHEAAEQAKIEGDFLVSSDDHYLCKDCDLTEWPRYWRGCNLPTVEYAKRKRGRISDYCKNLIKTSCILNQNGLSTRAACLHLNTWANPVDVNAAWEFANNNKRLTAHGFEPTCLINAMFEKRMAEAGITPEYTAYKNDWKVTAFPDCEQKIKDGLPGFSTTPAAEKDEWLVEWMNNYYSEPSKWEKTQ